MESKPDMYDFMTMVDDVLSQGETIQEKQLLSAKMIQAIRDITTAKVGLQGIIEQNSKTESLEDIIAKEMIDIEVISIQQVAACKPVQAECECSNPIMIKKKGATATGLYCKDCGKWKKWINRREIIQHTANGVKLIDHNMEG